VPAKSIPTLVTDTLPEEEGEDEANQGAILRSLFGPEDFLFYKEMVIEIFSL
jgi:hypothetical protein